VHWVIVGEEQVEAGIKQVLSRVKSEGVVVEGNSFLDFVDADFAIMCARAGENRMKASARRTLEKAHALYLSTVDDCDHETARARFDNWRAIDLNFRGLPIFTRQNIPILVDQICEQEGKFCAPFAVSASVR